MVATFLQHTVTPDGGLPVMFNAMETLALNMGFTPQEEYFRYISVSPNWLVYTKTNLTGTYSTTYWGFSCTTTTITLSLFSSFNTSTRAGAGANATYGVRSQTGTLVVGTTYRFDTWRDSDIDCKYGISSCYRVDDNIPFASPSGWLKFVPFSNFDGNKAATTLMFGTAANITGYQNAVTTGVTNSLGTLDTSGRFSIGYGILGSGIAARGADYDYKPTLVSPIVVGQGGLPYGYVDSKDLAVYSTPSTTTYTIADRLVTSDGKEYEPLYYLGHDVFVRMK